MTRYRFSVPPNWPPLPSEAWTPLPGWTPDTAWPDPPAGWQFWTPDEDGGATKPLWQFRPHRVDGHRHAIISLGFAIFDLILLVGAATWTVTTSVLGHPLLGQAEFVIFFVPMFPVFGYAVLTLRAGNGRRGIRRKPRPEPNLGEVTGALTGRAWATVGIGAVALVTVLLASVVSGTLVPPAGQPSYNSDLHRYELNDHGSISVISKAVYDHGSVAGGHFFTLGACIFLFIALPVHLGRWRYWRQGIASAR